MNLFVHKTCITVLPLAKLKVLTILLCFRICVAWLFFFFIFGIMKFQNVFLFFSCPWYEGCYCDKPLLTSTWHTFKGEIAHRLFHSFLFLFGFWGPSFSRSKTKQDSSALAWNQSFPCMPAVMWHLLHFYPVQSHWTGISPFLLPQVMLDVNDMWRVSCVSQEIMIAGYPTPEH